MKIIIFVCLMTLTGCRAVGTVMQGMGNGLQNAHRSKTTTLQPNYAGGFQTNDGQQCVSDYAGGYVCR